MIKLNTRNSHFFTDTSYKNFCNWLVGFALASSPLQAQTIAEKKLALDHHSQSDLSEEMQVFLTQVNEKLEQYQKELRFLYGQAACMFENNAPEPAYQDLLMKIQLVKGKINCLENEWREAAAQNQEDGYALWHQPNTTLEQLVIDYGSQDFVYIIPPEIAEIGISVSSNLPIPRASWDQMLELILLQNGVGVRQLNPFLRQLYLLKQDHSNLRLITNRPEDLLVFPSNERVAFFISPEPADVRRTWFILEKFVNPNSVVMEMVGRDILIIGQVAEIQELLKLYDFILANRGDKEYKTITLTRVDPEEMANILGAMFGILAGEPNVTRPNEFPKGPVGAPRPPVPLPRKPQPVPQDDNGLKVIPLPKISNALFLIGTREEIRKAENIIREVEDQVGESRGKVIHWYTTKHSDPEELAEVLYKIYNLMISAGDLEDEFAAANLDNGPPQPPVIKVESPIVRRPYDEGFFMDDRLVVGRVPARDERPMNTNRENFIVDLKTGAIVMVVEADILPKIKDLIRKLDVPKRMVQLEVVLFEKRLNRRDSFGLNLLRIGSAASGNDTMSVIFNEKGRKGKKAKNENGLFPGNLLNGVFEFLMSRPEQGGLPAFDIAYKFLLSQDDLHIHASPSVLAINQTVATIEIADEISVNTGIFEVETIGGVTLKDAFARAQYGIKIEITPTIHLADLDECPNDCDYVDLVTDINFQTIKPNVNDRPDVTTRHVLNEVSIPNGQTVIIGGLRQRNSQDRVDRIPFLGEIPYVGKLFGFTDLRDDTTEMFIFITPTIVYDQCEDLIRIRNLEMIRRPGDIPSFMCRLVAAEDREKYRLFADSMIMTFGRKPDRCVYLPGEYDGR